MTLFFRSHDHNRTASGSNFQRQSYHYGGPKGSITNQFTKTQIDELYEFSNDSTIIKCFERSTVERIEENSNDLSRCLFIRYKRNRKIYGHRKMWNKKLINRKKTTIHKDGSSALLNIALEMEGEKKKKKMLLQHGVFIFGHPSKYYLRRTGLNLLSRRNTLLSLWYIDSTVNAFFFYF